ncbi:MAG: cytochrome C-551 [Rhodoferax sp.]
MAVVLALASTWTLAQTQTLPDDAAKKLAARSGCIACHTIEHKESKDGSLPIGPAWEDVAKQYAGKPGAADFLTRIVLEGSNPYASHWKNKAAGIAMPPNAVAITESDARQMVYWILSLKK